MKVFNIFDFLNPKDEEPKEKFYGYDETREYILAQCKKDGLENQLYLNIAFKNCLAPAWESWFKTKSMENTYKEFKEAYDSFCWHLWNKELKIISYKVDGEYHLLYIPENDPFILESTSVKDLLKDYTCAPACAITWYNKDGTFATDYLHYRDGEELTKEIRQPKSTKQMSFTEYYRDRREYYFFNVLKIHKFAKKGRVDEKLDYDTFTNYSWRLIDITNYYGEGSVE